MTRTPSHSPALGPLPPGIAKRQPLLIGNRPYIDFANSGYTPEGTEDPADNWPNFLHFLALIEVIGADQAQQFANCQPKAAREVLARAAHLRETLVAVIDSIAKSERVAAAQLKDLNEALAYKDNAMALALTDTGFELAAAVREPSPWQTIGAVAAAAATALAEDDLKRVRKCAEPECPLFFYDTSKNGRRRWCRMDVCGNRVKAASFYRRSRDSD